MFRFRDKTIYIISPENWGGMKVSKHHYALELAERGNRVFFVEPPRLHYNSVQVLRCEDHPGIQLVRYKPLFRGRKVVPEWIYRLLIWLQVKRILAVTNASPDVVIAFQGYLFENLKWFNAPVRIFFPVDQFNYDFAPPEARTATLNLAISRSLQQDMKNLGIYAHRLNHALSSPFVRAAQRNLAALPDRPVPSPHTRIRVGFSGNLRMEALDRDTMMSVIRNHPGLEFVFWGSYGRGDLNLGGLQDSETDAFIQFLEDAPNTELRGVLDQSALLAEMQSVDLFWFCWRLDVNRLWGRGANPHKILEYLSTGKPIVSHYVDNYAGTNLLYMMPGASNAGFEDKFNWVIELVREGESVALIRSRLEFAIDNSYEARISEIEGLINHG